MQDEISSLIGALDRRNPATSSHARNRQDLISYHNDGKGRTVIGKRSRELK